MTIININFIRTTSAEVYRDIPPGMRKHMVNQVFHILISWTIVVLRYNGADEIVVDIIAD